MLVVECGEEHRAEREYIFAVLLGEFLGLEFELRWRAGTDVVISSTDEGDQRPCAGGVGAVVARASPAGRRRSWCGRHTTSTGRSTRAAVRSSQFATPSATRSYGTTARLHVRGSAHSSRSCARAATRNHATRSSS